MVRIIVGTTPSIHYNFRVADPEDFTAAYLTVKDEAVAAAEARGWTIKES